MKAIILCYHKVGFEQDEGRWLTARPDRLRAVAAFFLRRGYQSVRASQLADPWQQRLICFTFDDAYKSAIEQAVPILHDIGATASFYAVPTLVGKTSEWDGNRARPLADWDALRAAQKGGFEIGNHSATHARLADLGQGDQRREIRAAHELLVTHGIDSKSFCYPYGSVNEAAALSLQEEGYAVGLALGKRPARTSDSHLRLPRIVISYSDALPMVLYKTFLKPLSR